MNGFYFQSTDCYARKKRQEMETDIRGRTIATRTNGGQEGRVFRWNPGRQRRRFQRQRISQHDRGTSFDRKRPLRDP